MRHDRRRTVRHRWRVRERAGRLLCLGRAGIWANGRHRRARRHGGHSVARDERLRLWVEGMVSVVAARDRVLALGVEGVGVNRQLAIGVWNPVGPHDHCRHCRGRRRSPRLIWSPIAVEWRLLPRLRRRALDRSLHLHWRRSVARHLLGGGWRGKPLVGGGRNGILANVSELMSRR